MKKFTLLPYLLALIGFSAVSFLAFYNLNTSTIFFANDQATDFIISKYLDEGTPPLLGPPSHTGGRHLGPIYYYYSYFFIKLASFDIFNATILFVCSKLLAIAVLLFLVCKYFRGPELIFAILALVFSFSSISSLHLIRIQWHSHFLLLTSLLAFGSAILVVARGAGALPIFVICSNLLLQSHLSAGPAIIGLCAAVLAFCLTNSQRETALQTIRSKVFWLSVLAVLVFWIPTIIFEVYYPSNLNKLFGVHASGKFADAGLFAALHCALDFFLNYSFTLPGKIKTDYSASILLACSIFAFLHLAFLGKKNERWLMFVLAAPILVTIIFLSRFKPPLYMHYFNSSIIMPPLTFALLQAYAARILFVDKDSAVASKVIFCIFLLTPIILMPFRFQSTYNWYTDSRIHSFHTFKHVRELTKFIKADSQTDKTLVYSRLASKPVSNSYYYLLGAGNPEIEYKGFFPEIPDFDSYEAPKTFKRAYVVLCPKPFRKTESDIIRGFSKKWALDQKLDLSQNTLISDCSVVRLRKKRT